MTELIEKTSGLTEKYDEEKLIRSLRAVGTDDTTIQNILDEIHRKFANISNSQQIFDIATGILKSRDIGLASRYNLKKALIDFGPAGFPFEQYVAALFRAQGYKTSTNVIVQGRCVSHELDVVAYKNNVHHMIECKFHNNQAYKSDVKVSLYIKARFDDLLKAWKKDQNDPHKAHHAWIVTNTTFTDDAIQFARCVGISALSWNYPANNALKDIISQYNLHPITALVNLTGREKKLFLDNGLVLCRDADLYRKKLISLGLRPDEIDTIIKQAASTCSLKTN